MPFATLALVIGSLYVLYMKRNKAKPNTTNHENHIILKKDGQLKDEILSVSVDTDTLNKEFKELEDLVKANFTDTTEESTKEANDAHNRYKDIGKFALN